MSSAVAKYKLSGFTGVVGHRRWSGSGVVRDGEIPYSELDAKVRSGDYFVTIATMLDALSRQSSDYEVKVVLEDIISDLIYLQDNYTIAKLEEQVDN